MEKNYRLINTHPPLPRLLTEEMWCIMGYSPGILQREAKVLACLFEFCSIIARFLQSLRFLKPFIFFNYNMPVKVKVTYW